MHEQNPMLGLRGCRLGLMIPDFVKVQTRAILNALIAVEQAGGHPKAKIMIPLVGHVNELSATKALLEAEAKAVEAKAGVNVEYVFGTMIEVPRGALTADEIAREAAFFSFGTNDLTQMTFGYSRDDAEGGFLLKYVEDGILPVNPFQTLDDAVAGLMKIGRRQGPGDPARTSSSGSAASMAATPSRSTSASGSGSTTCRARRSASRSPGSPRRRRCSPAPSATSSPTSRPLARIAERSRRRMNGRVRRLFLDTAPLRLDRDYRWLWSGQVVNGIGNQITRIALPYQVFVLTGSTLAIGALTFFQLVPILLFALGAGSLADAVDRRRLLMADPGRTGGLQPRAVPSRAVRVAAGPGAVRDRVPGRWARCRRSAGAVVVDPAPRRSRAACLRRSRSTSSTSRWPRSSGPAVGGILIATVGLAGAYAVDLRTFTASFLALFAIQPLPPLGVVVAAWSRGDPRPASASPVSDGRSSGRSSSISTR